MAPRPINVVIKGDYSDKDVKRAIRDLKSLETQGSHTSRMFSSAGKTMAIGLAGAAAAAGAFAIKVGVDAVQAAIEEEQSVGKLTTTLGNLGKAYEDGRVEKFIDDLQFATGIADNQMRPAYDRLVRSTGSISEANKALGISLDIAVAKGRDVTQVADVMGKAYDGNTMALARMGVGIDKAILKTGNMELITEALRRKFGGQATANANTLGGAIKGVGVGWDELVESFGQGLVGSTEDDIDELKRLQTQLRGMQPGAEAAGSWFRDIALGAAGTVDALSAINDAAENQDFAQEWEMIKGVISGNDEELQKVIQDYRDAGYVATSYADEMRDVHAVQRALGFQIRDTGDGMDDQAAAADRLKNSLDRLNGKDRSVLGARLSLRQMLGDGPGKSGSRTTTVPGDPKTITDALGKAYTVRGPGKKKTVNFTTKDDALQFGLNYAQGVESLITAMQADGADVVKLSTTFEKQRRRLRGKLDDTLGAKGANAFVNQYLQEPAWLKAEGGAEEWRRSMAPVLGGPEAKPGNGGMTVYIDKVEVSSPVAWEQMEKEGKRRAAATGGRFVVPTGARR